MAIFVMVSCEPIDPNPTVIDDSTDITDTTDNTTDPIVEEIVFSAESGSFAANTILYRKALINVHPNEKPALCLYLHGGSARGNDNEAQLLEPGVDSIAKYLQSKNISAIFVVPQCPADKNWGGTMKRPLKLFLESYWADIDTTKVYCLGGSMGGTGVWGLVSYAPNFFAAAMPVAGNPTGCDPAAVATTPIYTVMGTADNIMNMGNVDSFIAEVQQAGGQYLFDKVPGWTHQETCERSYTSQRLNWIFSQQRAH